MRDEFLPLSRPYIADEEITGVTDVLRSGCLTTGPRVAEFEKGVEAYIGGGTSAVGLTSCTAGLFLALLAHGIGRGDEVIVPTWTFAATGHVVLWAGARPVLCDVDDKSLNIDAGLLESLITPRTKAVMPVHFAGCPCDMKGIVKTAKRHSLIIIEDAAHAMGGRYKDKKIGTIGDVTVFSFYATKNLTCGEGGMAVSRDKDIIEKIRSLSYFGINKKPRRYKEPKSWQYEIEALGYKYNMDSIHAAIGLAQLKRLDGMNERRRRIAAIYRKNLDKRVRFTKDSEENYHTYYLFPIRIGKEIMERDVFINELEKRRIGSSVHFIPLHRHAYYKSLAQDSAFPVADRAYGEIVSIPMFFGMSDDDVYYVIENINDILKTGGCDFD